MQYKQIISFLILMNHMPTLWAGGVSEHHNQEKPNNSLISLRSAGDENSAFGWKRNTKNFPNKWHATTIQNQTGTENNPWKTMVTFSMPGKHSKQDINESQLLLRSTFVNISQNTDEKIVWVETFFDVELLRGVLGKNKALQEENKTLKSIEAELKKLQEADIILQKENKDLRSKLQPLREAAVKRPYAFNKKGLFTIFITGAFSFWAVQQLGPSLSGLSASFGSGIAWLRGAR